MVVPPSIPFPRRCVTISFQFTPRVFPTPKRQSKSEEEEEVNTYLDLEMIEVVPRTYKLTSNTFRINVRLEENTKMNYE